MRPIHFKFDSEKLVQALAYFASRGVKSLDPLKAAKLLYFADRQHLLKYGRPITGDTYYCMKNGPIPTASLGQIQDVLAEHPTGDHDPRFDEYFSVDRRNKYPQFIATKAPDLDVFSVTDIEVLQEVADRFGKKTGWQLRDLSHEDACVKAADEERLKSGRGSVPIPFQAFFDAAHESMLAVIEADQENRDFADSLSW
jgi:uncharacterized phage-associated protein